jgi:catechol 2,3-dioxygenase-like lactoylglutathione lyase family enzyme
MIMHINTVAVYVDDQQKSLEFWTEKMGFQVRRKEQMGPNALWLEVGPKKGQTGLVLYPRSMMDNWAERKPSIVFDCADIDSMVQGLKVRGVEFTQEPKAMQ